MSRRKRPQEEGPGQDSFLDVVANLVGVLIILVMVVGTQAKAVMVQTIVATPEDEAADMKAVEQVAGQLHHSKVELDQVEQAIEAEEVAIAMRRDERARMLTVMTLTERQIEDAKKKLSEQERLNVEANARRREIEDELKRVQQTMSGLDDSPSKVETIKHTPTPLAKTVFGKEAHFRLANGRISYIPWDELVAGMNSEAKEHAWKLRDSLEFTETYGPIRNYHMRYTLQRVDQRGGPIVQLALALFVPVDEKQGETLAEAMRPGSEFAVAMTELDPRQHTITIWTYPDSFSDFRKLRETLHKRGFITAGRPLPDGAPIGASPNGTRSSGQ